MTQQTLRELARSYSSGEIHQDSYRKKRAELISGILAGEINLRENNYPDIILPKSFEELDMTEPKSDRKSQSQTQMQPPPQVTSPAIAVLPRSLPLPWIIAAGGLLVLSLALVIVFNIGPDEEASPVSSTLAPPTTPPAAAAISPQTPAITVNNLLQSFMATNDWSEQSLDGLRAAWSDLPEADRETARNSVILDQMTSAIHRQLLEERALIGLRDDASVIFKQQLLIALAEDLGIDDPRMTVQTPAAELQPTENPPSDTVIPATSTKATVQTPAAQEENRTEETPDTTTQPTPEDAPATEPEPIAAAGAEVTSSSQAESTEPASATIDEQPAAPEPEVELAKPVPPPAAEVPTAAERQSGGSACKPSLVNSRRPYCREKLSDGLGDGPTMVAIPAGRFLMGGSDAAEQPAHEVTIAKAFAMSVHEVTFGEYQQFCENTGKTCPDQPWTGKDYPVVNVSWPDAVAYTNWLSEKTGRAYRLPSEAEWEYAARGGTTTIYPFGDEIDFSFAVFSYRSKLNSPLPKTDRSINRNSFRLYHIIGNVREWVADYWNASYAGAARDASARTDGDSSRRVIRGGSYNDPAEELRSGARVSLPAGSADRYTGFRVIQEM